MIVFSLQSQNNYTNINNILMWIIQIVEPSMRIILDQNLTNWLNHPPYEMCCMVEVFLWFSFIDGLHREIKIYSMQANVYIEIVRPIW